MVQREVTAVGTVRKGEIRTIARLCRVDALLTVFSLASRIFLAG